MSNFGNTIQASFGKLEAYARAASSLPYTVTPADRGTAALQFKGTGAVSATNNVARIFDDLGFKYTRRGEVIYVPLEQL